MTAPVVDDEFAWPGKRWELRAALRAATRLRENVARSRRRNPATELVAAARELGEVGDGSFTVKQVADRAGVAVQTFYRHFDGKDELLLAVIEENIADGCREIAAEADAIHDPIARLRFVICSPMLMSSDAHALPRLRFHARERQRLSERYPHDVENALAAYRDLVAEAIIPTGLRDGAPADTIRRDADVVMHIVVSFAHAVGTNPLTVPADVMADHVWEFCLAALQRPVGESADGR
jgi:TetR/AcrR family transcriptional regulator